MCVDGGVGRGVYVHVCVCVCSPYCIDAHIVTFAGGSLVDGEYGVRGEADASSQQAGQQKVSGWGLHF